MKRIKNHDYSAAHRGSRPRRLKRLITGIICLALLISVSSFTISNTASAYTSLQHIESIVSSLRTTDDNFVILEIVPEEGSGSIGYYLDGCEPTANWPEEAARLTSPSQRKSYVDTLFGRLVSTGLLGTGDQTPLYAPAPGVGGYYQERYPWMGTTDMESLTLDDPEMVEVRGTFTQQSGPYKSLWDYLFIDEDRDGVGDGGGQYIQKIDYFVSVLTETGEDNAAAVSDYYYDPVFVPLNDPDSEELPELWDGMAVYTNSGEIPEGGTNPDGIYEYVGTVGQDLSLDMAVRYYYVETVDSVPSTGAPHLARTGYAAVSTDYIDAPEDGSGYFSRDLIGYEYVGKTRGDYAFDYNPTSGPQTAKIYTDTVFYSGGYSNNHWFLRYVFDRDSSTLPTDLSSMKFVVNSITPDQVTTPMVDAANMIVLSAGLDIADTAWDLTASLSSDEDLDLPNSVAVSIYNAASDERLAPVVVDYRLAVNPGAQGTNLGNLARLLISHSIEGTLNNTNLEFPDLVNSVTWDAAHLARLDSFDADKNFVRKNVFCYNPITAMPILVTRNFNNTLSEADARGFEAVASEISYENFLRTQAGITDLLVTGTPTSVRLSNILRYIINFGGQRVVTAKAKISVLEIQPGRGSELTPSKVWNWIGGANSGINLNDITITTLSTPALIGKIENLIENYDLIYIGTSTTGFNTHDDGRTRYNDSVNMDGLLYTNVGDTYKTNTYLMGGLLDRDFYKTSTSYPKWSGNPYMDMTSSSAANRFRFSGNDLTPTKAQELIDFSSAGYPIIYENALVEASAPSVTNINFSVSVSAPSVISGSSFDLTASVNIPEDLDYTIRWYYDTSDRSPLGTAVSGTAGSAATYRVSSTTSRYYYCVVSAGGQTARSNSIRVTYSASSSYNYTYLSPSEARQGIATYRRSNSNQTKYYTSDISNGTSSLQASSPSHNGGNGTPTFSYQWYKDGVAVGSNNRTYNLPANGSEGRYYCEIRISSISGGNASVPDNNPTALTNKVDVSRTPAGFLPPTSHSTYARAGTISQSTYPYLTTSSLNGNLIDSASYLYSAMNEIKSKPNVMTVYETGLPNSRILDYLNLSKPEIVFTVQGTDASGNSVYTGYPTRYEMTASGATSISPTVVGGRSYYYLTYDFTIKNATDATPSATRYDCRLYLDLNADGKYKPEEEITDIVVRRGDTGALVSPGTGNVYALSAGVRYVVTRQMPSGFAGIIPWKLEVVKNGAPHIHASHNDYSRIAPAPGQADKINILQISSSSNAGSTKSSYIDLQWQLESTPGNSNNSLYSSVTGKTYRGIYGKLLADVRDFNVEITTTFASNLSGTRENILNTLNGYDMIIIGFDDMYKELTNNAANAVVDFIDTGKAVLFTHDTTSLVNVPESYVNNNSARSGSSYVRPGFGDPAHWGYYFNTILRDAVKLDRYGITSGMRSYLSDQTSNTNTTGDLGNSNLSATEISNLLNGNYSVAFTPKFSRTAAQTEAETQGFTNYALIRYGQSGQLRPTTSSYSSGRETNMISQVNEGQITTYPYNVNTRDFGGTDSSITSAGGNFMQVSNTHEQYYQLNMNSDDIVVWYCLSNGNGASPTSTYYGALPNDVVNAYYIYNVGNVTYSGMGHSASSVANEAKLFVNTMIAAYRTVSEAPTVFFTSDETGNTPVDYYFLTTEFMENEMAGGLLEQDSAFSAHDPSRQMFFKISDPNLNTAKSISARLYYVSPSGVEYPWSDGEKVKPIATDLYFADSGAAASNLYGGLVYTFYLPSEVLNLLADKDTHMVKIIVRVETTIGGETWPGTDSIELRKVGLFTLR